MDSRGTFTVSAARGDPRKVVCAHRSLRTTASASAKVGCVLSYQAAFLSTTLPLAIRCSTSSVTSEKRVKSAGVVLRIASSDHCLCVSNPRCRRTSWKVTSSCQRITNQERIFCGSASRGVQRRAWVLNAPCGSRTKTQRRGTANKPVLYQTTVSEAISIIRSLSPYQLAIVVGFPKRCSDLRPPPKDSAGACPSGEASLSDRGGAEELARRARHPGVDE